MSLHPRTYTYGEKFPRTYESIPLHFVVSGVMDAINSSYYADYNVCFLNLYKDEHKFLGWHADNSPEMDKTHPIAVVSLGAARFLWIKEKTFKGAIPDENKHLLGNGSLLIMPVGFQDKYLHRIPKHSQPCTPRISLTFRRFK